MKRILLLLVIIATISTSLAWSDESDSLANRNYILNYPWDEMYTYTQYKSKQFSKNGCMQPGIMVCMFDNKHSFINHFMNERNVQLIGQDPVYFINILKMISDGNKFNGELFQVTYRKSLMCLGLSIKYEKKYDRIVFFKN